MKKNISLIDLKEFVSGKLFAVVFLLLPQLFLFAVNANSFYIISKNNLSELNLRVILASFILQFLPFLFASIIFRESVIIKNRKAYIPVVLNVLLMLSACAFMGFYFLENYKIIGKFSSKLIIEDHLLYLQFACMASSVIYPLLSASMWRIEKSSIKEIVLISISGILFPLLWFGLLGFILAFIGSFYSSSSNLIGGSFIIIFLACSLFSLIAFVRILSFIIMKTEKYKFQRNLFIGIVGGFFLPFAGLLLNLVIPFPGNFQYSGIYLLTFINALAVSIPETANKKINICLSVLRVILIPFVVYFFIILAPAIPFSFLLILLFGTGIILLSPAFLLLIHISKLRKDFCFYSAVFGKMKTIIAVITLLLVLPSFYVAKKYAEYKILQNASKYVLNDKSDEELKYPLFMIKDSLSKMYREKNGNGLPVLSSIAVQLSKKTLPQNKMDEMFEVFYGDSAYNVLENIKGITDFSIFGNRSYNVRDSVIISNERITSDAEIESVDKLFSTYEGSAEKHSVKITMKELTGKSRNDGFRGKIEIPDGVFVSGLKLKIGDKFEQGRIYEKTSAIWVFNEIKRRAQDPAVIYYLSDNELRFDVFPFRGNEKRECVIEFICPKGSSSKIKFLCQTESSNNHFLQKETIKFNSISEPKLLKTENDFGSVFYIPESIAKNIKNENRKPVLYIIADISKDSTITKHDIIATADYVKRNNPEIESASVCFVNYIVNEGKLLSINSVKDEIKKKESFIRNNKQGGFFYKKAVHKISSRYETSESEYPVFAIVSPSTDDILSEYESVSAFLPPDTKGFYLTSNGTIFVSEIEKSSKGVHRVLFGNGVSSVFPGDDSILYFAEKNALDSISYTDTKGNFHKLYSENAEGIMKTAFDLYSEDKIKGNSEGEVFKSLIESSKKSGIITSSTSYMVVENENQWKQLEDKEKEILDNEYAETYNSPEPGALAVISVFIIILGLMKLSRRRLSR
ncbi:MAG: MSEP-CTERM sorting domain-containing protein [Spirochaetes bacterium]|nr:MSEP-CTERM sorting domain-containing protein [Spirochaetota bacterium]